MDVMRITDKRRQVLNCPVCQNLTTVGQVEDWGMCAGCKKMVGNATAIRKSKKALREMARVIIIQDHFIRKTKDILDALLGDLDAQDYEPEEDHIDRVVTAYKED